METELEYYLEITPAGASLLKKCVDLYLERWPGGDPDEKQALYAAQTTLSALILENTILK